MRRNAFNVVLFMFLAGLMFFLWQQAEKNMPKPAAKKDEPKAEAVDDQKKAEEARKREEDARQASDKQNALVGAGSGLALALEEQAKRDADAKRESDKRQAWAAAGGGLTLALEEQGRRDAQKRSEDAARRKEEAAKAEAAKRNEPPTLVAMGDDSFFVRLLLTTRGAGVQQLVLTRFDQADRLGRAVKEPAVNDRATAVPLHLIPGVVQERGKFLREDYPVPHLQPGPVADVAKLAEPSYALFHYRTTELDDKHPDPLLGELNWKVASEERPEKGDHKVVFETELGAPYFLKFRKIYTLSPNEYHVGLRVEVEKMSVPGAEKGKGQTRLQISGPRGLPIEGEWYTSTYRVAVVGWLDKKGTPRRQYEEAASIGNKRGGEVVTRSDEKQFKYMVVANQYFASGVAIDDGADNSFEKGQKNPWAYVRATTEIPFDKKQDPNLPYFDDLTVRAASEPLDLAPGEKVAYSYLLYNGPSKVRLLKLMSGENAVAGALVDRYRESLSLQTITDFRSDTWLGRFASAIWWTDLVIVFTNLMHWLLALIHAVVPNWALSIVLLTVCVRLLLFYPSRKQTAMSMKMMEVQKKLQPEFEKLYEKYKDDLHTYNREKTRLMMANGANPFAAMGGCLLLLAQMPIMMGLYFCLQESVFFRLEPFLWMDNLAAPDMLVWWGEQIPYVSTPEDVGSFLYLGPFFNLLPILAVGLMLWQQAKMMPPSTDPQAEQQRMMMKMMMVMMAVFFYKVAAGLALYFIVSTLWGIIERQLIPKPEVKSDDGDGAGATADATPKAGSPNGKVPGGLSPQAQAAIEAARAQKPKGFLGRLREALQKKMEEMQKRADEQSRRQIRNDPNRPDGGAPPGPGGGGQGPRRDRDKKKKRRK